MELFYTGAFALAVAGLVDARNHGHAGTDDL
jgi:hypothetical protein